MEHLVVFVLLAALSPLVAQEQSTERLAPTHADVRYGEHERNGRGVRGRGHSTGTPRRTPFKGLCASSSFRSETSCLAGR